MKFARRIGKEQGRTEYVAFEHSFHGRTMGALSLTWTAKYREPFEPLDARACASSPRDDLAAVAAAVGEKTAAVMLEPVQGEGGIRPATPEFLKGLEALCRERGALLVFDEIQCGLGRTGKMFAYQHSGVVPDMLTLAKPLGGGLPMGAILLRGVARAGAQGGRPRHHLRRQPGVRGRRAGGARPPRGARLRRRHRGARALPDARAQEAGAQAQGPDRRGARPRADGRRRVPRRGGAGAEGPAREGHPGDQGRRQGAAAAAAARRQARRDPAAAGGARRSAEARGQARIEAFGSRPTAPRYDSPANARFKT